MKNRGLTIARADCTTNKLLTAGGPGQTQIVTDVFDVTMDFGSARHLDVSVLKSRLAQGASVQVQLGERLGQTNP